MTEHESNLLDLYAGLAMMGWIMNGDYSEETIPYMAHDIDESEKGESRCKTSQRRNRIRHGRFRHGRTGR